MLGRKAILHSSAAGRKRKWQLQQEDDEESSEGGGGAPRRRRAARPAASAGGAAEEAEAAPREAEGRDPSPLFDLPADAEPPPPPAAAGAAGAGAGGGGQEEEEGGASSGSDDEKKGKAFAWMDSDDEVSDGAEGEEEAKAAGSASAPGGAAGVSPAFPPAPPAGGAQGAPGSLAAPARLLGLGPAAAALLKQAGARPQLGGMLMPPLKAPAELLPGTRLPPLTNGHLGLMAKIAGLRTLGDLWSLVDSHSETFAASHAATSLCKLCSLGAVAGTGGIDPKSLERHGSFARLRDRVDELLSTDKGRATFLPADLAMVAASLAKVVPTPATEGALGRIFADIADEAEARLASEPRAFTPPMLADLSWGIAKSGEDPSSPGMGRATSSASFRGFFGAAIEASVPRLEEMTCQDLANLAAAFGDALREDADVLLKGVFAQTQQRLKLQPQPINALFGGTVGPGAAAASAQAPSALASGPAAGGLGGGAGDEVLPPWQLLGHSKFTGAQIVEISVAMSKHIRIYEAFMFDLVAAHFHSRLQEFSLLQLQRLRDAFDTVRHERDPEFMASLRAAVKQREALTRRR